MKIATFTYTDSKGKTTERKIMLTGEPSNKFSGIDISSLDEDSLNKFIVESNLAQTEHMLELTQLSNSFELTSHYRQFIPERMQDLEITYV